MPSVTNSCAATVGIIIFISLVLPLVSDCTWNLRNCQLNVEYLLLEYLYFFNQSGQEFIFQLDCFGEGWGARFMDYFDLHGRKKELREDIQT